MAERIEGINSIREAIVSGRKIHRIMVARGASGEGVKTVLTLAREKRIPIEEVDRGKLDDSGHSQGIVAEGADYRYYEVDDLLKLAADRGEPPFILLLDGIEDPQNLGAIIRSAECFGVHGVVIPKHQACAVTPAVSRVSAGAAEHMRVAQVTNLIPVIEALKKDGLWVVGTDADADTDLAAFSPPEAAAVVIGSEGKGMRRLVRERCDFMVKIPLAGRVQSLNASVSTAVVLYEIARHRRKG